MRVNIIMESKYIESHDGAIFLFLVSNLIVFLLHISEPLKLIRVFELDGFMTLDTLSAGHFILAIDRFVAVHALCLRFESTLPWE